MIYRVNTQEYLECLKPEPVCLDKSWLNSRAECFCPKCMYINRNNFPKPADIILANPPQGHTSILINKTGLVIWRRDFLDHISAHTNDFIIGRCFLPNGKELDQYATFYNKKYIVVCGNRQSHYYCCSVCGTISSYISSGPEYVLENDLEGGDVYQDSQCQIYLSEKVAFEYDFDNWGHDNAFAALEAISIRKTSADAPYLTDKSSHCSHKSGLSLFPIELL